MLLLLFLQKTPALRSLCGHSKKKRFQLSQLFLVILIIARYNDNYMEKCDLYIEHYDFSSGRFYAEL